jgi:hypothetical protein
VLLHTLPDYYFDSETANLTTKKIVSQILMKIKKEEYYNDNEIEKLKNSFYFSNSKGLAEVPWFLK